MSTMMELLNRNKLEKGGLKWERDTFTLTPVWTKLPDVECIKRICRDALADTFPSENFELEVQFLDEGAFNRVYQVDVITSVKTDLSTQLRTGQVKTNQYFKYAFRVALPVDPDLKSSSEVATLQFLSKIPRVVVPRVLSSAPTANNALGFEWMLQTYAPGKKLSSVWNKLGHGGRERMIKQLAKIQVELSSQRFSKIGNIYTELGEHQAALTSKDYNENDLRYFKKGHFTIGQIVSFPFVLSHAMLGNIERGPFYTTHDWLHAQLLNVVLESQELQKSSDEDDLEAAERSNEIAKRLLDSIRRFFPNGKRMTDTILFHDDLSQENIFCDEDGTITAILDWEATPCLPFWVMFDLPQLLQGPDYPEEPDPKDYYRGADDLLFQDRLLMWQRKQLKSIYVETMDDEWLGWSDEYKKPQRQAQRDFRNAVNLCTSELAWNTITKWLDANDRLGTINEQYVPLNLD